MANERERDRERTIYRRGRRGTSLGLLITLALHAAVFLAVRIAHGQPQPPLEVKHDFVAAELVKLGKKRDPFWLPRITQPPPPPPPKETIKVAEDPNAKAAPKEAPRPDDPKLSKQMKHALSRAEKLARAMAEETAPDEGLETGSKIGTANQATGDQYKAGVGSLLSQNFQLPAGIAPDQISKPPVIKFHIAPSGMLSDIKLVESSGNSFVDDACVSAAQITRKVDPPPPDIHGLRAECIKQ